MLTKKAKYGLKAMLALAEAFPSGNTVGIAELATKEHIPLKFLEAILLELKNQGFLKSKRGPGGGYSLAKSPESIMLSDILRDLDGPLAPVSCVSKTAYRRCEECPDEAYCRVRMLMSDVRDAIVNVLERTSLQDALNQTNSGLALPSVLSSFNI